MARWTYLHNLDPFLISFTENFGIRWYGLAYIAGFILGYMLILQIIKKGRSPLTSKDASNLINYAILGVLAGGRLGYCLVYQPELWIKFHSEFPFWGVLEVHKGGMASHGGIIGLFLACVLFARKYKLPALHLLDLSVLGGGVGFFFGRIANFINGELYGRVIETKAWFGVQFPHEIYSWHHNWNQEKLASLKTAAEKLGSIPSPFGGGRLTLNEGLWTAWVESKQKFTAEISSTLNQIISAVENGKTQVISALSEVLPVRHPSQLYQSVLEGLIPLLVIFFLWRTPKKAGIISGVWGISYLVMRVIGEQFREPDSHIGFDPLGLTRGQSLSVLGLILVGCYMYYAVKRKDPNLY